MPISSNASLTIMVNSIEGHNTMKTNVEKNKDLHFKNQTQ